MQASMLALNTHMCTHARTHAHTQIHAEAKLAEEEDKRIVAQHQATMSLTKGRGSQDERRRGSKDEWQTKGEKERAREKPKLDTRRLAGLAKGKMKDSMVSGNSLQ